MKKSKKVILTANDRTEYISLAIIVEDDNKIFYQVNLDCKEFSAIIYLLKEMHKGKLKIIPGLKFSIKRIK